MRKNLIQLSLTNRVYLINIILLCITVIGAVIMVWYTYKTEKIFKDIVNNDKLVKSPIVPILKIQTQ